MYNINNIIYIIALALSVETMHYRIFRISVVSAFVPARAKFSTLNNGVVKFCFWLKWTEPCCGFVERRCDVFHYRYVLRFAICVRSFVSCEAIDLIDARRRVLSFC